MAEVYRKSDKAHTIYKNKEGKRVPGASTIANGLAKPALLSWANRIGLDGIEMGKYVDSLATAGTLAHYMIECDLRGMVHDAKYLREFSEVDKDRAENAVLSYFEWKGNHTIETMNVELKLVSEKYQYGGQLDSILRVDGVCVLVDIKTSKALYGPKDDKWTQLAGYDLLAEEHRFAVEECRILRVGREESEGFEYVKSPNRFLHRERFLRCLDIYNINKEIGR